MISNAFPDNKTDYALRVKQLLSNWTVAISFGHLVGRALESQLIAFSEDLVKGVTRWFRSFGLLCQALLPEVF